MAYKTRAGESQHAARERIAREKGFASYRAYRNSSSVERERASRQLAQRDASYPVRQVTAAIRRRASAQFRTAAGSTLTSTDLRRQRAHVASADPNGLAAVHMVVQVGSIDRRRRQPGRSRGRDTGNRTLRFTVPIADTDADEGVDAFTDWLESAVDDALDNLYAGGSGSGWSIVTMSVTV